MLLKNGLSLGTKLIKVIVRFSAFKKQKKSHLIQPSLGILLQEDLTNSFMLPQWGL
jgi:hypothetical protein